MESIQHKYKELCETPSDINEHLPTLYKYASECESIVELGVRGCISSWAFLHGLLHNGSNRKSLLMNDIEPCNIDALLEKARGLPIQIDYTWINDLELNLVEPVDMVFIDTWHVYAQLKRELIQFAPLTKKYIVMHDTEVDALEGETIRQHMNGHEQARLTGFPLEEILCGLKKAVDDFLADHPEWRIKEVFTNCNGLTILERTK